MNFNRTHLFLLKFHKIQGKVIRLFLSIPLIRYTQREATLFSSSLPGLSYSNLGGLGTGKFMHQNDIQYHNLFTSSSVPVARFKA